MRPGILLIFFCHAPLLPFPVAINLPGYKSAPLDSIRMEKVVFMTGRSKNEMRSVAFLLMFLSLAALLMFFYWMR